MTPTFQQQLYRSMVRRRGVFSERRLRRECPECGREMLYCIEGRRCERCEVCTDSLCIACGWQGSSTRSDIKIMRALRGAMKRGWVALAGEREGQPTYRLTAKGKAYVERLMGTAS